MYCISAQLPTLYRYRSVCLCVPYSVHPSVYLSVSLSVIYLLGSSGGDGAGELLQHTRLMHGLSICLYNILLGSSGGDGAGVAPAHQVDVHGLADSAV
jgi:hypothetical protein